jgi:glutamate--cysteine ligase catalytic subunit
MFEYGSWMFEMIPDKPYNTNCDFYEIINSIRKKYEILSKKPRIALTIPVIPFMGVRNLNAPIDNLITQSKYIDDSHIANHPRFRTLTKHIRMRRGEVVNIKVPIYQDLNTKK